VFQDRGGRGTLEASSTAAVSGKIRYTGIGDEPFSIVSDLQRMSSRFGSGLPADVVDQLAAGYRSVLNVRSMARNQVMRLGFFSRHQGAFSRRDVPAAQHVADCVAVAVAYEQLAAAERDRAEARGRA